MSNPAGNQALSEAVLRQMRKDWHEARPFLQVTQCWPDTDCEDVSAAIAAAVEQGDTAELLSWSVWLASKAADARRSGFAKARADEAHRALVMAEAMTTQVAWAAIRSEITDRTRGEDRSRMSPKARA